MINYTCDMCGKELGAKCIEVSFIKKHANLVMSDTKMYRQIQLCEKCTDNILFKIYNYKESKNE